MVWKVTMVMPYLKFQSVLIKVNRKYLDQIFSKQSEMHPLAKRFEWSIKVFIENVFVIVYVYEIYWS